MMLGPVIALSKQLYIKLLRPLNLHNICVRSYGNKRRKRYGIKASFPNHYLSQESIDMLQKTNSQGARRGKMFPPPSNIKLAVVMTGGPGTTKGSLMLSTELGSILFNCGEGFIKHIDMNKSLRTEAWVKMTNLNTVFITHKSWECIAGLHGFALSKYSMSMASHSHGHISKRVHQGLSDFDIELYGPDGIEDYINMTQKISQKQDQQTLKIVHSEGVFRDSAFTVSSVVFVRDYVDEKEGVLESEMKSKDAGLGNETAFAYICKANQKLSHINMEKCVDVGIKSGPMVGKLKGGHSVTLDCGKVITPDMVVDKPLEDERPFLIIDCPNKYFLTAVTKNADLEEYMTSDPAKSLAIVCHFTPSEIYNTDAYQTWMKRFHSSTHHLVMNHEACEMSMDRVKIHQSRLHLVHPGMFPLFKPEEVIENPGLASALSEAVISSKGRIDSEKTITTDPIDWGQGRLVKACPGLCFNYRGKIRGFTVHLETYNTSEELARLDESAEFVKQLGALKTELPSTFAVGDGSGGSDDQGISYPKIVFFGTGSMEPMVFRSQSCILVQLSKHNISILDCGEDAYGQMFRYFGRQKVERILRKVQAIFVSHMHADHHIGLLTLLRKREQAFKKAGTFTPCYVMAPIQMRRWLKYYHEELAPSTHLYKFLNHQGILDKSVDTFLEQTASIEEVMETLHLAEYSPVKVDHCPNAYGVTLTHNNGIKVTYSGDTRPCDALVEAGQHSDVLIHEATHEDELIAQAKVAKHTTFSEAIDVSRRMNAKHTILTHFSQRYAYMPLLDGVDLTGSVGVAFDNMRVVPSTLSHLPQVIPVFNAMFEDDLDILRIKTTKKRRLAEEEDKEKANKNSKISKTNHLIIQ